MRRRTFLAGAAGATAAALTGCASGESPDLRFEGWDFEPQLVEENLARFMQRNPGIRVDYTPITSAQFIQKITAEFMGGSGPDAMYMYDDYLSSAVDAEWLQPLDGLPGIDAIYDAIYPVNAAAMTYQGKRWGVPYYTDCTCLVFNRRILAQAGITQPPRTLDELEHQAQQVQQRTQMPHPIGVSAQLQDTAAAWLWSLAFANGTDLFDDRLEPTMGQPGSALEQVFAWLQRAATQTKVIDPAAIQTLPIPLDNALMAGQYAYILGARYGLRKYNDPKKSKEGGNFAAGHVPPVREGTHGSSGTTRMYVMKAGTRHRDEALTLLNYLGGFDDGVPYTARFWFDKQGLGFPFRALAQDPGVRESLAKWIEPGIYAELAESARQRSITMTPWYAEFEAQLQRRTQEVLIGRVQPAQACRTLDEVARGLTRKYA